MTYVAMFFPDDRRDVLPFSSVPHIGEYVAIKGALYLVDSVRHEPSRDPSNQATVDIFLKQISRGGPRP